jgi:hypothetical protein
MIAIALEQGPAEGRWYPFVVGAGAGAGLLAAAVGFIKVTLHWDNGMVDRPDDSVIMMLGQW